MAKRKAKTDPAPAPVGKKSVLDRLRGSYGEDPNERDEVSRFVTSSPSFNRVCGLGGLPLGRVVLCWGPYRGGKSTLAVRMLAAVAEAGGLCYYSDIERAAVKPWFRACGLPDEAYVYSKPRTQEAAQDEISAFLREIAALRKSGDLALDVPVLVVVDTVTKFVPEDKLSGKVGSRDYGLSANLVNDWLKTVVVLAEEANACLWLVSQERRDRAGIWSNGRTWPGMPAWMQYRPTTGDALLFDATLGLRISAVKNVKKADVKIGKVHEIRVMKNKLGPDLTAAGIGAWFTANGDGDIPAGIDDVRELVAEALEAGVVTKPKGKARIIPSWDPDTYWSGEAKIRKALHEDAELYRTLFDALQANADDIARGNGHSF